ncbi:DNA replication/repair protein RecF [Chelativorans sp. Marseille-P2723]|uniref:DNA replication/repair protein RecF n=1 Tax=Chelativorans sp. Marseille-P2723 TaxID=2709133 RepID=UPI00157141C0|nr:DNA replication/repair protein RecF [Chelativorans sp. Marseille-P2723]
MTTPLTHEEDGSGPAAVHLTRLALTEFRNYQALGLELAPGLVVLTGENGAGKTNLLEAISFLSPGRGLRRARLDEIRRIGAQDGFAIHATIEGPHGMCRIGTGTAGTAPAQAETSRRIRINGEPARSAEALLEWLRVIWLTPAMDALFTGPSADRRRFLDRLVLAIDPAHGRRALDYERAMRSRNRLFADNVDDDSWFSAIEREMAETGVAIAAARSEMLRLLSTIIEQQPGEGPFPKAVLALDGILETEIAQTRPAVDVEEAFREKLRAGRARDRAAGRTLDGPHRTDLRVRHEPKDMPAERCSTGEQKALLVGLVLAHARLTARLSRMAPVLLLDEIAAHFDADRRAALFEILEELNSQVFMTGTEAGLFPTLRGRAQFFTVSSGAVLPG